MKYEIRDERGSFLWVSTDILDRYGSKIGPIGIAVYCALSKFADNKSRESWPSHKTIATLIGSSVKSVQRYLEKLASFDLIQVDARFGEDGKRTSNGYTLLPSRCWTEGPIPPQSEGPIPPVRQVPYLPTTVAEELDSYELYPLNYDAPRGADETSPPPTLRLKKQADPRTKHPAIRAVRGLVRRYPPKVLWDQVIEILGDAPSSDLLKECYAKWCGLGFNVNSWVWLLEWYKNGGAPKGNGRYRGAKAEPEEVDWFALATGGDT